MFVHKSGRPFSSTFRLVRGALVLLCALCFSSWGCNRPPGDGSQPISSSGSKLDGRDAEALRRITQLIATNRLEKARRLATPLVEAHPDNARANFLLGMTYHRQAKYAAAREWFERAISLDPEDATPQHFLGYCLYYLGEMEGARHAFEAHLVADPTEPDSHFGLAISLLELGEIDEAEAHLQRSIDLIRALQQTDPRRFRARRGDLAKCCVRLADVYLARDDLAAARDALQRALQISPSLDPVYATLCRVHREMGRDDLAAATERARARMQAARQATQPEGGTSE